MSKFTENLMKPRVNCHAFCSSVGMMSNHACVIESGFFVNDLSEHDGNIIKQSI